jgi:hypothetical protein
MRRASRLLRESARRLKVLLFDGLPTADDGATSIAIDDRALDDLLDR